MADQNTRVERERIGTRIDEDITGLESRDERDRVGSFADTDRAPSRPRVTASKASTPTAARHSRTREIRAEIEQTREDLSETVNAIQDRLQPSTLASNAVDSVKDAARERFRDIADTETVQYVRANPMPTAMIGIGLAGLAWLAFGRETQDTRSRDWDGRRDWRVRSGYEFERDRQLPGDQMDYERCTAARRHARGEPRSRTADASDRAAGAEHAAPDVGREPLPDRSRGCRVRRARRCVGACHRERKPGHGPDPRQSGRGRPAGGQRQGPGGRECGDQCRVTSAAGSRPEIVRAIPSRRSAGLSRGAAMPRARCPWHSLPPAACVSTCIRSSYRDPPPIPIRHRVRKARADVRVVAVAHARRRSTLLAHARRKPLIVSRIRVTSEGVSEYLLAPERRKERCGETGSNPLSSWTVPLTLPTDRLRLSLRRETLRGLRPARRS